MNLFLNVFEPEEMMAEYALAEQAFQLGIRKAKQELRRKVRAKLTRELANYGLAGTRYASETIVDYTEFGLIVTFPDYWLYVEFGTGIRGESNPHPDITFEGEFEGYNVGKYSSDPRRFGGYGHWPYPREDGTFRITAGRESSPIIYKTWIYAQDRIKDIYDKNLKAVGF